MSQSDGMNEAGVAVTCETVKTVKTVNTAVI